MFAMCYRIQLVEYNRPLTHIVFCTMCIILGLYESAVVQYSLSSSAKLSGRGGDQSGCSVHMCTVCVHSLGLFQMIATDTSWCYQRVQASYRLRVMPPHPPIRLITIKQRCRLAAVQLMSGSFSQRMVFLGRETILYKDPFSGCTLAIEVRTPTGSSVCCQTDVHRMSSTWNDFWSNADPLRNLDK